MAGMIETNLDGFRIVVIPHEGNEGKTIRAFRLNDHDEITDCFNLPVTESGQEYLVGRLSISNDELRERIEQETEEQRRKTAAELIDPTAGPEAGRDGSSPSP